MNNNDRHLRLNHLAILQFYYGSTIYKTTTSYSDIDIICVVPDDVDDFSNDSNHIFQYRTHESPEFEYQYIPESVWINMIKEHHIIALEALSLPDDSVFVGNMQKYRDMFVLDKWKLRQVISTNAEHAWAKAHKKMTVDKDYDLYKAKKSLFHTFRLLSFGKQIAETGHIFNYKSCHDLWDEIIKDKSNDWEHYKEKYKHLYNEYRSQFVKVAPKPIN